MEKLKRKNHSGGMEIEDHVFSITEREASKIERPLEKRRIDTFWWLISLALLVLGGRIFYLNIIQGKYYQAVAKENKIRSISVKAPRGKIFDRNGNILVNNVPGMDAVIIPADLPSEEEKFTPMVKSLSDILGENEGELVIKIRGVNQHSLNPVLIKENISQKESLSIIEKRAEFPGVMVEQTAIREYIDSNIFAHVLGYEGKIEKKELENNPDYSLTDYIGKQGIEKSYEKDLRGVDGALQVEVDSVGNIRKERGTIKPKPGSELVLGLDAELQKKIYDSLSNVLEKTGTKTAAAVAINPKNGEILALISLPSFDNNFFARGISGEQYLELIRNPNKPLFNRAISGEYPPGSTLKPVVAVAGLSEKTITPDTTVNDSSGAISIGAFRFGDWKVHGLTDVRKAIAESCDVFFYSVGGGYGNIPGLGMNRMKKYENSFGLGMPTGVDIPGESTGLIPDEQWKLDKFGERWYVGDSYHSAIGQGFITLTPIQLANYIAAIANGGVVYKPHLVSQIRKEGGAVVNIQPEVLADNTSLKEAIDVVREGMRQTVTTGTAQTLKDSPVEVAGKTGTAQFGSENRTHAWFVSFAPYEDPEIAMAVLVEGGGEGHSSALPVTKEVYDWYFSKK